MSARTVKVSNVSLGATEQDIKEFFSFSGEIEYVEMQSGNERSQTAYVTFKDSQGADTAVLLAGATIVDQSVDIALVSDYKLPPAATAIPNSVQTTDNKNAAGTVSAVQKAEDVLSSMLARGFTLGKDAVNQAKAFNDKNQFSSSATAKVVSLDQKIGISEKISTGTTMLNEKMKEVDEKFQVSEKTKTAFAAAEQTISTAGSAIMKSSYVLTGASWVTGAFSKVAKAASDVGQKAKEKMVEEERGRSLADGYGQVDESDSPKAAGGLIL